MPDNVTRIHPAPSIQNPLMVNPLAALTDDELREELERTRVRIDAAEHTLRSLMRESARRQAPAVQEENNA